MLQDGAGNDLASFSARSVVNRTGDTTVPAFSSAEVNGATLTVAFSEDMDAASRPAASAFRVKVGGGDRAVTRYDLAGDTATLTLARPVEPGQTLTVAYAKPGSAPVLQDLAGNDLAAFTPQTVTNRTGTRPTIESHHVTTLHVANDGTVQLANPHRNSFTTGGASSDRYALESVTIDFATCPSSTKSRLQVQIRNSSGQLGNNLTRSGATDTYNASGITLHGATTYFLVFNNAILGCFLDSVSGDGETGAAGWSIANNAQVYNSLTNSWISIPGNANKSLKFRVNATSPSRESVPTLTPGGVTETGPP